MTIISVIGPKGGIGKTTLSINTTAALTRALSQRPGDEGVCLVDLDLRLPTISSLLDSHPRNTFYDLFEQLANNTYQVDFLRTLYQIITRFHSFLEGEMDVSDERLAKNFSLYKTMNHDLFRFGDFQFGDALHELFLYRGEVFTVEQLSKLRETLAKIDTAQFRNVIKERENNSWPVPEEYINYIEEYGFSIIGGEVPVLGKRAHRRRVNEPEFLLLFLEFLDRVLGKFSHVVLDTPAGGVNHLSSLMNVIDQVLFVFDLSNSIAVNGSIDALHSFIDYYEDFYADFQADRLTGLDKAYVNRVVAERGTGAILDSMERKRFGIMFNRCQDPKEILNALERLREYLDTLDKLEHYKDRIHILGMVPNHKVINITNNRGALFYNKDMGLTRRMDSVADSLLTECRSCPVLGSSNEVILNFLNAPAKSGLSLPFKRWGGGQAG